jgi:hypothetical protein
LLLICCDFQYSRLSNKIRNKTYHHGYIKRTYQIA